MKKEKVFLITGQSALVFGLSGFLINELLLNSHPILAFLTGMMLGLSLVLNLAYLLLLES